MKRLTLTLGLVALAAALAACSGASAAPAIGDPAPVGSASGDGVTVVAKDIQFATPLVSAKAGSPFTLTFDNQDGAPHNIAISDASGAKVFKGDIVSNQKVDYKVPALAAGTYTFSCEVHPEMKGTLTVH